MFQRATNGGGGGFTFEDITSRFAGTSKTITSAEAGNLIFAVAYMVGSSAPNIYLNSVAQTVVGTSNKMNIYAVQNVKVGDVISWDTLDAFVCLRQV